jgi:hypothetical protein
MSMNNKGDESVGDERKFLMHFNEEPVEERLSNEELFFFKVSQLNRDSVQSV